MQVSARDALAVTRRLVVPVVVEPKKAQADDGQHPATEATHAADEDRTLGPCDPRSREVTPHV